MLWAINTKAPLVIGALANRLYCGPVGSGPAAAASAAAAAAAAAAIAAAAAADAAAVSPKSWPNVALVQGFEPHETPPAPLSPPVPPVSLLSPPSQNPVLGIIPSSKLPCPPLRNPPLPNPPLPNPPLPNPPLFGFAFPKGPPCAAPSLVIFMV